MRTRVMVAAVAVLGLAGTAACESDGDSSSPNTNSQEEFCGLLLSFRATNDSFDGEISSGDPARAKSVLSRMVSQVDVLQDRAPGDIKPDVDTVATFVRGFDGLMARNGYDIAVVEASEEAIVEFGEINSDAAAAALDQLRAYAEQDCA